MERCNCPRCGSMNSTDFQIGRKLCVNCGTIYIPDYEIYDYDDEVDE